MLPVRTILSVVALLWGFLQAPFDHIHPGELEHEATTAPVHMHGHLDSGGRGPSISPLTADDDEIDVLWSLASSAHVDIHPGPALATQVILPIPSLTSAELSTSLRGGHDPPERFPRIPRAPPV